MNNESIDLLDDYKPKKLPATLNVLTIMTFIGCGFSLYLLGNSIHAIIQYHEAYAGVSVRDLPAPDLSWAKFHEQVEFQYKTRYLLMAIGVLSVLLCLIGAIMIRKLQKRGLYYYLFGELGFPIFSLVLYGFTWTGAIDFLYLLIPIFFAAFYFTQRLHLR